MSEKNQNMNQSTSGEAEKIRKGFVISAVNHNFGAVVFSEDEWNHRRWVLQGLLDCENPDVTTKVIGGREFQIICEADEGWRNRTDCSPSVIRATDGKAAIFGSCLVIGSGDTPIEEASLTDEDIRLLSQHVMPLAVTDSLAWNRRVSYTPVLIVDD